MKNGKINRNQERLWRKRLTLVWWYLVGGKGVMLLLCRVDKTGGKKSNLLKTFRGIGNNKIPISNV
tara:strand:- start:48 stop:245 length:198 start_codon:yes stop_codon:yes gene_type:complete